MRVQRALGVLVLGLAAACGPAPSATPLPTIVLDGGSPSTTGTTEGAQVTASGHVVAAQEVRLAFPVAGIVEAVNVSPGDPVRVRSSASAIGWNDRPVGGRSSPASAARDDLQSLHRRRRPGGGYRPANAGHGAEEGQWPRPIHAVTEAFIDNLKAQITLARKELADATRAFNHVEDLADNDPGKARAQVRMSSAQINLNKLVGNYNWYTGQPSEIDVALTYANLDAANEAVQEAQWFAAALRGEPLPAEASGARLAELEAARGALTAAQAGLDSTRLLSPIAGEVVTLDIFPGEYATPGQVVVVVSDVQHLRVETADLSERDVAAIEVGQTGDSLHRCSRPGSAGTVLAVSPVADILGGDVVYKTTILLESAPAGLRAGMSANSALERLAKAENR